MVGRRKGFATFYCFQYLEDQTFCVFEIIEFQVKFVEPASGVLWLKMW